MSIPTRLLILLTSSLLLFGTGFGIGWHFKGNEDAGATLAVQKQEVKQGNMVNARDAQAAQAHEAVREQVAAKDRIVVERVAVAVAAAAPDYHTCQLKVDDLDLLNQSIGGSDVSER